MNLLVQTFITFVTTRRNGHVEPAISVRDQFARFDYLPSTADTEVSTTDSLYIHQLCRIVFQQTAHTHTYNCTTTDLCFNRCAPFDGSGKNGNSLIVRSSLSLSLSLSVFLLFGSILGQLEMLCVVRFKSLNYTD